MPQELVEKILFFSDPGDAGTLCIYPEQVSALPKEKRGGWEKRWPACHLQEIYRNIHSGCKARLHHIILLKPNVWSVLGKGQVFHSLIALVSQNTAISVSLERTNYRSSAQARAAVMLSSLLRDMLKATVSSLVNFKIYCSNRNIVLLSGKSFANAGECPEGLESFLSKDLPILLWYAK